MNKVITAANIVSLFLMVSLAHAQEFSGIYQLDQQGRILTLTLQQDAHGKLSGTLSSTTGPTYSVDGVAQNRVAVGKITGIQSSSYFQAHPRGDDILFAMIESDVDGRPDYNRMKQLLFVRRKGHPASRFFSGAESGEASRQASLRPPSDRLNRPAEGRSAPAAEEAATLAGNRYSDPTLYFKIVPPAGWRIEKYPQGPAGKVAFVGPEGVKLSLLATSHKYQSFEKMLADINELEKMRGDDTNTRIITFFRSPAIKRISSFEGTRKFSLDFMVGYTTHHLEYSASSAGFEKYLPVALDSLNTYEPTLRGLSMEAVTAYTLPKSLRLSHRFFEQGNYYLALEFINEGLAIAPDNASLLELKKKIRGKR